MLPGARASSPAPPAIPVLRLLRRSRSHCLPPAPCPQPRLCQSSPQPLTVARGSPREPGGGVGAPWLHVSTRLCLQVKISPPRNPRWGVFLERNSQTGLGCNPRACTFNAHAMLTCAHAHTRSLQTLETTGDDKSSQQPTDAGERRFRPWLPSLAASGRERLAVNQQNPVFLSVHAARRPGGSVVTSDTERPVERAGGRGL